MDQFSDNYEAFKRQSISIRNGESMMMYLTDIGHFWSSVLPMPLVRKFSYYPFWWFKSNKSHSRVIFGWWQYVKKNGNIPVNPTWSGTLHGVTCNYIFIALKCIPVIIALWQITDLSTDHNIARTGLFALHTLSDIILTEFIFYLITLT